MRRRRTGVLALALGGMILVGGAVGASAQTVHGTSYVSPASITASARSGIHRLADLVGLDDGAPVAPGTLDDGKDLLPQAGITVDQAVAAAQASANGPVGEVDLEHFNGQLVFNVDIGDHDVKVDAQSGAVLASDLTN